MAENAKGMQGLAPSTHVLGETKVQPRLSQIALVCAIEDYTAKNDDELSFKVSVAWS